MKDFVDEDGNALLPALRNWEEDGGQLRIIPGSLTVETAPATAALPSSLREKTVLLPLRGYVSQQPSLPSRSEGATISSCGVPLSAAAAKELSSADFELLCSKFVLNLLQKCDPLSLSKDALLVKLASKASDVEQEIKVAEDKLRRMREPRGQPDEPINRLLDDRLAHCREQQAELRTTAIVLCRHVQRDWTLQLKQGEFGPIFSLRKAKSRSPIAHLPCELESCLATDTFVALAQSMLDKASLKEVGFSLAEAQDVRFIFSSDAGAELQLPLPDVTWNDGQSCLWAVPVPEEAQALWEEPANRKYWGNMLLRLVKWKTKRKPYLLRFVSHNSPCKKSLLRGEITYDFERLFNGTEMFELDEEGCFVPRERSQSWVVLIHNDADYLRGAARLLRKALLQNNLPEPVRHELATAVGINEKGEPVPMSTEVVAGLQTPVVTILGDMEDWSHPVNLRPEVHIVSLAMAENVDLATLSWFLQQKLVMVIADVWLQDVVELVTVHRLGWQALGRLAWLSMPQLKQSGWRRTLVQAMRGGELRWDGGVSKD